MVQRTRLWTMAIATAGLISLPIIGTAQSYPSSSSTGQSGSGQSTTQSGSSSYGSTSDQNTPQWHLDQAKKDLDGISSSSVSGDAYPVTVAATPHHVAFSTGERLDAA